MRSATPCAKPQATKRPLLGHAGLVDVTWSDLRWTCRDTSSTKCLGTENGYFAPFRPKQAAACTVPPPLTSCPLPTTCQLPSRYLQFCRWLPPHHHDAQRPHSARLGEGGPRGGHRDNPGVGECSTASSIDGCRHLNRQCWQLYWVASGTVHAQAVYTRRLPQPHAC